MAKKFNNINEELERIKTLMFETDNLILNKEKLNESVEDESTKDETVENESMDEQTTTTPTEAPKTPKSFSSSFKVAKVSDINTLVRGGAAKFDTFKMKGTGATQLFDERGQITKDGMDLAKKSLSQIGVSLTPGQTLMRIGKKDIADKDKVFFQIIPATELSVVTQNNEIKNLDPKQLEQLPVVKGEEKKGEVTPPKGEEKKGEGTPIAKGEEKKGEVTPPKGEEKKPADSLIGVKLSTTKLPVMDATKFANAVGYKLGQYFINKDTKDVYRVQDGIITAVFKKSTTQSQPIEQRESFNMDLIYTNPLLFESIINEADAVAVDKYNCVGDCRGQGQMSDKFKKFVDDALSGKETETTTGGEEKTIPIKTGPGTDEDWKKYPCVTTNTGLKKVNHPTLGVLYKNPIEKTFFYSNGRWNRGTEKGSFSCVDEVLNQVSDGEKKGGDKTITGPFNAKEIVKEIYRAIFAGMGEDEDAVYEIFKNKINSDENLKKVLDQWITTYGIGTTNRSGMKDLPGTINQYFSSGEVSRLNQYVSKYSTFQF